MRVDSRLNKYNPRNSSKRAVKKSVTEIEAHYTKRAKKLDELLQLVTILIHSKVHISPTV